jgi:hypothetical protein
MRFARFPCQKTRFFCILNARKKQKKAANLEGGVLGLVLGGVLGGVLA